MKSLNVFISNPSSKISRKNMQTPQLINKLNNNDEISKNIKVACINLQ